VVDGTLVAEQVSGTSHVGIGLVGCGNVGALHLEALTAMSSSKVLAVADPRPERAASYAERCGAKACGSLDELLEVPGVDLVDICTPSGTHGALGVQAASAGKHVVVEKPIDVGLDAARALIDATSSAGVVLSVISQHRFDPGALALKAAVERGRLGLVVLGEGHARWYRAQSYYDADDWRGTWALDGGALMNQGVHLVDQLCWLLGPVESVFARSATRMHKMEAEDAIVATICFASGALGSLSVTTASAPGAPETLFVGGSEGSARLRAGTIVDWEVPGARPAAAPPEAPGGQEPAGAWRTGGPESSAAAGSANLAVNAHRAQLQDVVDAIVERRQPRVTGQDGWQALAVVRAAYESVRQGREVSPAQM